MKKIAIVLSGCGVFDGSEIHEAVSVMLAIAQAGQEYQCVAPNVNQTKVVNHLTQKPMNETRNVLVEAARIARGDIIDLAKANVDDYEAAIYPGGFGAVCNSSDFAEKGADMTVQKDVLAFGQAMAKAGKPQGFICIAPVLISKIYGSGVEQTIGHDKATASAIEKMGGKHVDADVHEAVVDKAHKVVSSPAYMLAQNIQQAYESAKVVVKDVLALI